MSHKVAKAARQIGRAQAKAAAQANRQRLYQLCLARCEGDLGETAKLFQTTSSAFPEMSPRVQTDLLAAMESSLRSVKALREQAAQAAEAPPRETQPADVPVVTA